MSELDKFCRSCWYWKGQPNPYDNAYEECKFTGLRTEELDGEDCHAHRPRELGEPCGVWVEVPPKIGESCDCDCDFWGHSGKDYCIKRWMVDGKPGPGCPRWKGEVK